MSLFNKQNNNYYTKYAIQKFLRLLLACYRIHILYIFYIIHNLYSHHSIHRLKIYRSVRSSMDVRDMQIDLYKLSQWS